VTGQDNNTVQALRARRAELAAAIASIGFTATGTVLQVRTACGSPGCACHADPDKRHGPYWQYTRKIRNKTVTRRLTPAQAALYQEWIANERALRDLLAQMQQISDQARDLLLADPEQGRQ
jgi:Family of unknown function (DUF6788)